MSDETEIRTNGAQPDSFLDKYGELPVCVTMTFGDWVSVAAACAALSDNMINPLPGLERSSSHIMEACRGAAAAMGADDE